MVSSLLLLSERSKGPYAGSTIFFVMTKNMERKHCKGASPKVALLRNFGISCCAVHDGFILLSTRVSVLASSMCVGIVAIKKGEA